MKLTGRYHALSLLSGIVLFFGAISIPCVLSAGIDCENADTTAAMRQCADLRYQKADTELNRTYRRIAASLDETGRKKLQLAQRAWIEFRDLNAEFVGDSARGGTLQPLLVLITKADMTERRLEELGRQLK